ncbi:Zinc finger protein CONSTANS 6 [Spatholobus suberectus]|nr:Zinc finger protein CONSTANS 6 [Spatholobus suberectus]
MISTKSNEANAVGAKTARACDSCIKKRARWYCAADDAFLCQACDSSVHSANPLAHRHHRVRLNSNCAPSWHKGFTKKPRTPRHGKHAQELGLTDKVSLSQSDSLRCEFLLRGVSTFNTRPCLAQDCFRKRIHVRNRENQKTKNPFDVVPEVCPEDTNSNSHEESAEEVLFRVPVCATPSPEQEISVTNASKVLLGSESAFEIAEFAADVESLLGTGLESECVGMEELGLVGAKEEGYSPWECCVGVGGGGNVEVGREEAFELGFDCDGEANVALGLDESKDRKISNGGEFRESDEAKRKKILLLRLDYDAVITAWASQKSPWIAGYKPDLDTLQCWPHCMGTRGVEFHQPCGELGGVFGCHPAMADGGREARVSRYREKRRTRLFSKKIRYEVRKLNAENRPRMKGRFVKRASFVAPPTLPLLNK